jgi:uncharacterized protein
VAGIDSRVPTIRMCFPSSQIDPFLMGFLLDIHELPRRAGEYRDYTLDLVLEAELGLDLISIARDERIHVAVTATSVDEGVLIRGKLSAIAKGECARCLKPVVIEVDQSFDELFEYPSKATALSDEEVETDEILLVEEDHVNLATPIRDAILLALPVNPLCEPDCLGLCSHCGVALGDMDQGHSHEQQDQRWSALSGLAEKMRQREQKDPR